MIQVGKLVSTHGLGGRLVFAHNQPDSDWLTQETVLYLETEPGRFLPFFIEAFSVWDKARYRVQLEGVTDLESAKALQGVPVWLKEPPSNRPVDGPASWVGFSLIDQKKGRLGPIADVIPMGPQWIAQLFMEGREVLIPLAEDLIVEINPRNQWIRMNLPDGLLEIYLDPPARSGDGKA